MPRPLRRVVPPAVRRTVRYAAHCRNSATKCTHSAYSVPPAQCARTVHTRGASHSAPPTALHRTGAPSLAGESEAEGGLASCDPGRRQHLLLLRQVQQRAARLASGPLPHGVDGALCAQLAELLADAAVLRERLLLLQVAPCAPMECALWIAPWIAPWNAP